MGLLSRLTFTCFLAYAVCVANGSTKGNGIQTFELKNGNLSIKLTNYGAHLMSVIVPDRYGKLDDVLLGYDTAEEYITGKTTFAPILGRVGNRISNAQFTLNGITYKLDANEGNNTNNSGRKGYSTVLWNAVEYRPNARVPRLVLSYNSFDGEQGFPGNLTVMATYELVQNGVLRITITAKALNKATPVNLIFHPFWNLAGQASGDILSHKLQIFASKYIPVDAHHIPSGDILPVKGTAYDFLTPRTIGSRISEVPAGYDTSFVVDGRGGISLAAVLSEKTTGRRLDMMISQPGFQLYSGDNLNLTGKGGVRYKKYAGVALEPQGYPNAVNQPKFPSQILYPGQVYKHFVVLKFSAA